jgi:hypothetical protein
MAVALVIFLSAVADDAAALFFVLGEFAAIIVYIDKIYKPNPGFILL